MTTFRFDDLRQYSDVLRSRSGNAVTVRFVEPRDAAALQNYFRSLTTRSRYNRFLVLPASCRRPCSINSSISARLTASAWSRHAG